MNNIRTPALALLFLSGSVATQQVDIPTRCPSLPSANALSQKDMLKQRRQAEAEELATETQAAIYETHVLAKATV